MAPALHLPLIDKDEILEGLFESQGVGDAAWRRRLSRESDRILQAQAVASEGAVLVSHWHLPGMPSDSGTPLDWLRELSEDIVDVHCVCEPELAARRFFDRQRHPGHLDRGKSYAEVLASVQAAARFGALKIGLRIDVDAAQELAVDLTIRDIRAVWRKEFRRRL